MTRPKDVRRYVVRVPPDDEIVEVSGEELAELAERYNYRSTNTEPLVVTDAGRPVLVNGRLLWRDTLAGDAVFVRAHVPRDRERKHIRPGPVRGSQIALDLNNDADRAALVKGRGIALRESGQVTYRTLARWSPFNASTLWRRLHGDTWHTFRDSGDLPAKG